MPTGRAADYRQHGQAEKRVPGNKDPLSVGPRVGRIDHEAFGHELREVVRHHALHHVIVFKAQSHPESLGAGACSESLAVGFVGVAEVADEMNALHILQVEGDQSSGGVQHFQLACVEEMRGHESIHGVAIEFTDGDLLVG